MFQRFKSSTLRHNNNLENCLSGRKSLTANQVQAILVYPEFKSLTLLHKHAIQLTVGWQSPKLLMDVRIIHRVPYLETQLNRQSRGLKILVSKVRLLLSPPYRSIAQLVARPLWERQVAGSNPATPTKLGYRLTVRHGFLVPRIEVRFLLPQPNQ